MSPKLDTTSLSKTGFHIVPLLVDFHIPPDADAIKTISGLLGTTSTS